MRSEALRLLVRALGPHRLALVYGTLATVGVVAMRLGLPWPLRGIVENVFPSAAGDAGSLGERISAFGDPVLIFCLLYLLLAVATGTFEWIQRVWMARVASLSSHDLRAAAVAATSRRGTRTGADRADLITRIIGDSARLKAGLKGIFIHLIQNALLLFAITALFLYLAPKLGLLFLLSGLLAILIGYGTVEEVAETTSRQRKKESKYAAAIQEPMDQAGRKLNRSSAKKEVRITRIIGRSTLLIHAAVAATLGFAFWIGVQDVRHGLLAPGELFLFIAYAITIQRRAVMIGRQVARGGKVLANAERIGRLIGTGHAGEVVSRSLAGSLRLEGVRLKSSAHAKKQRLGPLDLTITRGEHMLVIGGAGAGKSSLLGLLAGAELSSTGRILWDDAEIPEIPDVLRKSVAYLPDDPRFGKVGIRSLLGLAGERDPTPGEMEVLLETGAWKAVSRLRDQFDQVVESAELSPRERRALVLAGIALGDTPLWVIDEPVDGDGSRDRRLLEMLLARGAGRTVVVGLRRALLPERFHRVVVLKKGQIALDGSPDEWKIWRERMREIRRA